MYLYSMYDYVHIIHKDPIKGGLLFLGLHVLPGFLTLAAFDTYLVGLEVVLSMNQKNKYCIDIDIYIYIYVLYSS